MDDEVTTIDVAEGSHLQRKESEYLLKPDSSSMLNSREMVIPGEGDYPESSPQEFTGILEGKNVNKTVSSLAAAEHTCSGHLPVDDAGIMIEELTLRNYNGANLAVVGPSNNRDRMQIRQNQWQHIHLLAGGQGTGSSVRDSVRRDNGQPMSSAWEDVGYSSFPEFLAQKQSSHDHNEVREQVTNCENRAVSGDTLSPGGIRTKILSKSGFSEFFIKNSLKGKGVICRGPARDGFGVEIRDSNITKAAVDTTVASDSSLSPSAKTATPSPRGLAPTRVKSVICTDTVYDGFGDEFRDQNNTKAIVDSQVASDLSLSSSAKTAVPSAHGSAGTGPCHGPLPDSSHDGVNLREWLRAGHRKINKVESLYIFRQIVDLVDVSHSQGVAMQNLRPSCFKLLPSNQVAYLGSSVQREMLENAVDQDVSLKNLLSGKRSLEKGMFPSISLSGKKQNDRLEEKWYTSPMELSEGVCTFSSNIYCLGVLLFELLGSFDSEKARAAAVSDLRHRILPPNFLSENPKEAGFCLWLLHPESSSRPTTREILQSEVISGLQEVHEGDLSSSIEQEDVDSELLLHFLILMKEQKHKHATKLVEDIRCLEADIEEVERRTSPKKSSLLSCSHKTAICASEKRFIQEGTPSAEACSEFPHFSDTYGLRLMRNISQLESAYFSMRSKIQLPETDALTRSDKDLLLNRENFYQAQKNGEDLKVTDRLGTFFNGLCKYARYSKFEVRGILRNGDFINSANVICSLSFDRDEDYLAAAGVSKKIKIFEFHALFNDSVDIHYPVIEMTNKSKLSCICWNNYIKNYLASTDYDGVVKLDNNSKSPSVRK
uniref:Protein SPA1-related 2 n=1 Tax=Vitis vinifera TaxID=29760 RepID=F6HUR9_VITVI